MAEGRGLHILNIFKGTQCHHLFAQMPLPPGMGLMRQDHTLFALSLKHRPGADT